MALLNLSPEAKTALKGIGATLKRGFESAIIKTYKVMDSIGNPTEETPEDSKEETTSDKQN